MRWLKILVVVLIGVFLVMFLAGRVFVRCDKFSDSKIKTGCRFYFFKTIDFGSFTVNRYGIAGKLINVEVDQAREPVIWLLLRDNFGFPFIAKIKLAKDDSTGCVLRNLEVKRSDVVGRYETVVLDSNRASFTQEFLQKYKGNEFIAYIDMIASGGGVAGETNLRNKRYLNLLISKKYLWAEIQNLFNGLVPIANEVVF